MQSVRVVVENTICDVKRFKVLNSNKFDSVISFQATLGCALALHNFTVRSKENPIWDIPECRAAIVDEYLFGPSIPWKDVNLHIPPNTPDLESQKLSHIGKFIHFLPSVAAAMTKAVELAGDEGVFFPTVRERGRNLNAGAYLLQLRVQGEDLDNWTVKYTVGASYSYGKHVGYVQMRRDDAVVAHVCDCFSG